MCSPAAPLRDRNWHGRPCAAAGYAVSSSSRAAAAAPSGGPEVRKQQRLPMLPHSICGQCHRPATSCVITSLSQAQLCLFERHTELEQHQSRFCHSVSTGPSLCLLGPREYYWRLCRLGDCLRQWSKGWRALSYLKAPLQTLSEWPGSRAQLPLHFVDRSYWESRNAGLVSASVPHVHLLRDKAAAWTQ